MNFVHLHTKSEYSILASTLKTGDLLERIHEINMPGVALTDNNLFGAIEFYSKARSLPSLTNGTQVNPIIGMELTLKAIVCETTSHITSQTVAQTPDFLCYKIVLLAKNNKGYHQLVKLSTQSYYNNSEMPYVDFEFFKNLQSDCIILSGGINSELFFLLKEKKTEQAEKLISIFKNLISDRFYLEIHDHQYEAEKKVIEQIILLGKRFKIPLVATNEVCYLSRNDWISYEVLYSIGTKKEIEFINGNIDRKKSQFLHGSGYHLKTYEEMLASFSHIPESLTNTLKIAEQCRVDLKDNQIHMPTFPLPKDYVGKSIEDYLRKESFKRLKEKKKSLPTHYEERLNYELEIIIEMGFASYFVIVADFIDFAKSRKILVGGGRGSAAGSLISYSMGITSLDPIEYGLYFERFLNPERISFPDIDIDFEDRRRGEVIDYVKEKYGNEQVAQIITFGKLKTRAVFKDVARVFKIDFEESNRLSAFLKDASTDLEKEKKGSKSLLQFRYEENVEFATYINNSQVLQMVYEQSLKLENLTRQIGIHAAGIVIADRPLSDYVPLAYTSDSSVVTQYDKDLLEPWCGLIKMDFLGIRMLTVIKDAVNLVRKLEGVEIDIDNPPLEGTKESNNAFRLFSEQLTEGIFQFASVGMKRYLAELMPTTLQELIAMNALYRPGPMSWIPVYIAERRGKKAQFTQEKDEKNFIRFKKLCDNDPPLKAVLEETSFIPIYQEQIMEICRVYAGFTLGRSDIMRKAMGKKDVKLINQLREEFIEGGVKKGHTRDNVIFVYDKFVEPFGGYGFNKSHSACYAFLAYQTAFLKGNYPSAYMVALLNSELLVNNTNGIQKYINECFLMKIHVMGPDINRSDIDFQLKNKYIIYGLGALKNVGLTVAKNIVEERANGDYRDLGDFLLRHKSEKINKQAVEGLIKSGAFDSLGTSADLLLDIYEKLNDRVRKERENILQGQMNLFELTEATDQSKDYLYQDLFVDLQQKKSVLSRKRDLEKEAIGFSLKHNLAVKYQDLFEHQTNFDTSKEDSWENGRHHLAGVISLSQLLYTRKDNKSMIKLEVNNGKATVTVIGLPPAWEKLKIYVQEQFPNLVAEPQIAEHLMESLVYLKISIRDDYRHTGKKSLFLDELSLISEDDIQASQIEKVIWIEFGSDRYFHTEEIKKISSILSRHRGNYKVNLLIKKDKQKQVYPTDFRVNFCDELKWELSDKTSIKDIRI